MLHVYAYITLRKKDKHVTHKFIRWGSDWGRERRKTCGSNRIGRVVSRVKVVSCIKQHYVCNQTNGICAPCS